MAGRFSLKQGTDLGSASAIDAVNLSALPIGVALGDSFEQDGCKYQWVQVDLGTGSVASIAGGAALWEDEAAYLVTTDATDAETPNSIAGGFLMAGITDSYYTVIQWGGIQETVKVDAGTSAGDQLSQGATDQTLDHTASGTASINYPAAIALTDVATGTSTVKWTVV